MDGNAGNDLTDQVGNTFGVLRLGRVRIGRIDFGDVVIEGREAAINWQQTLESACEKTKRYRIRKDGTRYPEPLPMGTPARLLSVEIQDHLGDMARRNLRTTTIDATARTLAILKIVCGDIPVSKIDHKHIYTLWDLLRWAPPNITTAPELQGSSAEQLIAQGKAAGVACPATSSYELHRRFLCTFFTRLEKARVIAFSPMAPFAEMKKDLMQDEGKAERLFDDKDLQKIFNPDTYIPWASKFPHRWWGPILGLYTGARVNEVAQLKVSDVGLDRGQWCIHIRKTVDADLIGKHGPRSRQSLKGKSAVRKIPIPQPVLQAGFLDFLEDMKACGHPRLFPHLSAGINNKTGETNARYSQGLVIQFGRYMKELGFPKGVGFHAFRHTIATELDDKGIIEEDVALITGHSVNKKVPVLRDAYIHKKPQTVRARQVAALGEFLPPVELPVYTRGQFKERLRKGAKFYP